VSYLQEFAAEKVVTKMLEKFKQIQFEQRKVLKIMEVCGTHTQAVSRMGLRELLPRGLELISGPGCPICVTPTSYLDTAIKLARREDVIIATFADLLKVPGSNSSLQLEQAQGRSVKTVYSPLAALEIAAQNPKQEVIFLAVGFETTAPLIALSVIKAEGRGLKNYSLLQGMKTMPPVMKELVADKKVELDGFLCPGHVASIIGVKPFKFLAEEHGVPAAVAGFAAGDIVFALLQISKMIAEQEHQVLNSYPRVVDHKGNQQAVKLIEQVFRPTVSQWRGLGKIADSGLEVRTAYQEFAAQDKFDCEIESSGGAKKEKCSCGEILRGIKKPVDCPLFGQECTPSNPCGPCMVSQEGSCYIKWNFISYSLQWVVYS